MQLNDDILTVLCQIKVDINVKVYKDVRVKLKSDRSK